MSQLSTPHFLTKGTMQHKCHNCDTWVDSLHPLYDFHGNSCGIVCEYCADNLTRMLKDIARAHGWIPQVASPRGTPKMHSPQDIDREWKFIREQQ